MVVAVLVVYFISFVMPRRCNVYLCKGNYKGEPYTRTVSASEDDYPEDRQRWIAAMPNERRSLDKLKHINVCVHHFDCEWVTVQGGGKRPTLPPSIFPGVPKSCVKQTSTTPRTTKSATADARSEKQVRDDDFHDKIKDFQTFSNEIQKRYEQYTVYKEEDDLYLSMTDNIGKKVLQFIHFKQVKSHFGFLFLERVEKIGIEVPKKMFPLQKNSLLSRWTQVNELISAINSHEADSADLLKKAIQFLKLMTDCHDLPQYQFVLSQLHMLLSPAKGRRYDKDVLILAAELHNISPAAYKMLRKSGSIALPSVKLIKQMLSKCFQDVNLKVLFEQLKPEQRLVNVLFDEVKLTQAMRFTGGHVLGHAQNVTDESESEILATHALVIEIVSHYGGPRYILRVIPVAKLNAADLEHILLEVARAIVDAGGCPISFVCDNCPTNQGVYGKLGGPAKVYFESLGRYIFLVYDYVHIFKNIRNNWITVDSQQISFDMDGKSFLACWSDIRTLYEEDRKSTIRMTKLTHTSVYPKPLQRQSVPLVSQVFNDKTVAALIALKSMLKISEGTIVFVRMISNWFKMMNVKGKFSGIHLRDDCRSPWTVGCESFKRLNETCDVVETCAWKGGRGRKLKLTKQTASAFIVTTKSNIDAAIYLLTEMKFDFVLPAIFADEVLEKFFGQARQRSGGNFYIDIVDITAAAKTVNLHNLLKYDTLPIGDDELSCSTCTDPVDEDDTEIMHEHTVQETQSILDSADDSLKHKIVYIAGHLVHKFGKSLNTDMEEEISSEYLAELNRGGLSVPTLSTVFFVHSAYKVHAKLSPNKQRCRNYLKRVFSLIDATIASNAGACLTLANTLLKAFVLNNSDRERELGCLRRREKLKET